MYDSPYAFNYLLRSKFDLKGDSRFWLHIINNNDDPIQFQVAVDYAQYAQHAQYADNAFIEFATPATTLDTHIDPSVKPYMVTLYGQYKQLSTGDIFGEYRESFVVTDTTLHSLIFAHEYGVVLFKVHVVYDGGETKYPKYVTPYTLWHFGDITIVFHDVSAKQLI